MSNGDNKPSVVAWIALVVAVLAFVFAWVAYNQTGENVNDQIRQEVEDVIDNEQNGQDTLDGADADINGTNVQQQYRREI